LDVKRVVGYREFCNKLWNIVKFALSNFPADFKPKEDGVASLEGKLSLADKWILTRCSQLITSTNQNLADYKFGEYSNNLYEFWKKELADVYLEAIKPVVKSGDSEAALNTLYIVLDASLKMLHPSMPYISEELYQRLPHLPEKMSDSICIAPFPTKMVSFEGSEDKMAKLLNTVKAFRSQLSALNVATNAKPTICVSSTSDELSQMFKREAAVVASLVKAGEAIILNSGDTEPAGCIRGFASDDISIYVKVIGLIDVNLEIARINKRIKALEDFMQKLDEKIKMPGYESKVPESVRKANSDKMAGYETELNETRKQLEIMEKLI